MAHARIMSISHPVPLPGAHCTSRSHPKWVIRRKYVETTLLPQVQRLGFKTTELFEAVTDEHFIVDSPAKTVTYHDVCFKQGEGVTGNLLSHYDLWGLCLRLNEPVFILEDDALLPEANEPVVMEAIRHFESIPDFGCVLYLQSQVPYLQNSLKVYHPTNFGASSGPLIQLACCNDLSGTIACCVRPKAAERLMERARRVGTSPTDNLLNLALNEGTIGVLIAKDYQHGFMLNEHWADWNH